MARFSAFVLLWAVLVIPATLCGEQSEQSAPRTGNSKVLLPAFGLHALASGELAQAAAKGRWQKFGFPDSGQQVSPSGKQRRSLAAGIAGVGLMAVGAWFLATSSESATVSGGGISIKVSATSNGRRYGGIGLIGGGAALAVYGLRSAP
jgi:hypothetical protein